jgi:hypothetical protein
VLSGGPFTVILISENDPLKTLFLVVSAYIAEANAELTGKTVFPYAGFASEGVHGTDEKVIRNVVQVPPELKPRPGG